MPFLRSKKQRVSQYTAMPPKRVNRGKAKEKKAIITRLMEISLILDDYVYMNNPISVPDAQAYIKEISMYKTQCLKDERSLQVIEKLTRCMNSIVDKERKYDDCEQQNTSTKVAAYSCPSPTYSLVDEDIDPVVFNQDIQDTQVTIQQKVVGANSEQATIDVIDLCAKEDNEREHREFNIDVEMHRALSNLSINNPLYYTTDVCSQSILDNFESLNPGSSPNVKDCDRHATEKSNIVFHQAPKLCASSATDPYEDGAMLHIIKTKCTNNERTLIRSDTGTKKEPKVIDLIEDENPCKKKVSMMKVVRFERNINNKEANNAILVKERNKNVIEKVTRKRNKNSKGKPKNQENIETRKKPRRQVNKQKTNKQINFISEDTIFPMTKTKLNSPNPNSTVATKLNTAKTSCGINYDSSTSISNNTQKVTPISDNIQNVTKHCVSKIYSNNIENDFSWMENIRFVREIEKEEVDINLSGLNESFWEDLSFPNDWDEHEFDV